MHMDDSNSNIDQQGEDVFERLPDHLLHLIFNKIHDAKSLCVSLSVSKRFHSLIPQTDSVSLVVPLRPRLSNNNNKPVRLNNKDGAKSDVNEDSKPTTSSRTSPFNRILNKLFLNPLKRLVQIATQKSSCSRYCDCQEEENMFDLVSHVLKNFEGVKSLNIELPAHGSENIGLGSNNNLLKWKAEFGENLESCVILGATSSSFHIPAANKVQEEGCSLQEEGSRTSYISEEELKERVVWIVSSLMAASARHYMVGEVVKENRRVERVVITDGSKQGRICLNKRQVGEMRDCERDPGTVLLERSRVPRLRMKLWYVAELELEGGVMMKGVTMVVIRPIIEGQPRGLMKRSTDGDLVKGAFVDEEKVFCEAATKMVKKKATYTLEMNSF